MSSMRRGSMAIACALMALLGACGDDGGATDMPAAMAQPLTCMAGQARPCPCVGQGTGMQMCNATGNGYGACTGCPAPAGQGGAPSAGSSGARAGSGGAAMAMSSAGTGGSGTGGQSSAGAGAGAGAGGAGIGGRGGSSSGGGAGASSGAGGMDEPSPTADAEPGTSCGVGLPVLCELMTEKCCVRSLSTDTCIEASAMCTCSVQGCTVMEARCDGPEDCASGQVCCGTLSGDSYSQFTCATSCQSNGQQRVACHQTDMPSKCPSGLICANSQLLTNVQVCIDPASIEQ